MMDQFILVFHFVVAIALVGLVLLQQGKGAEVGASFGAGASQTVFGSAGSWNFFSKVTVVLATLFFFTSVSLAIIAKNRTLVDEALLPELQSISADEFGIESTIPQLQLEDERSLLENNSEIPVEE